MWVNRLRENVRHEQYWTSLVLQANNNLNGVDKHHIQANCGDCLKAPINFYVELWHFLVPYKNVGFSFEKEILLWISKVKYDQWTWKGDITYDIGVETLDVQEL